MQAVRMRRRDTGKHLLSRDQLARWAMQMAPEHLFAMLAEEASVGSMRPVGGATRLDTQAATHRWLVDGLYLRVAGSTVELWLVEMQSRAARRKPGRTVGLLLTALRQLADLNLPEESEPTTYVVEVRTAQAARSRRNRNLALDEHDESMENCEPVSPIDFTATNRLLFTGPWTQVLLAHPPAWPLWAFGRQVTADEILDLVATIDPDERYAGSVAALLRSIGRVRFPQDERFRKVPEREVERMSHALAQLEDDGLITAEERKERVRQYLAELEAQEERQVNKGREIGCAEGRAEGREALLRIVSTLAPDAVVTLESITDLSELETAVQRIIVEATGAR